MTGFETKTEARRQEWVSVIRAMEECLVLYRHKPGSLVKLWAYLYDRTGGSICALSDLIREAAIEAVLSEDEAITRKLMEEIDISELAQRHYKGTKKPKAKPEDPL